MKISVEKKTARFVSSSRVGGRVSWVADTPNGTAVRFRIRGGNDAKSLFAAPFTGPDGTSKSFYAKSFVSDFPYVQYEVLLVSSIDSTPRLKEVRVGCHTDGESQRSFSDEGIGEFSFAPVGGWGCAESLGE